MKFHLAKGFRIRKLVHEWIVSNKRKRKKPTCIFWGDYGWTGPEQPVVLPNYSILRNHKDTRLYNKIRKKRSIGRMFGNSSANPHKKWNEDWKEMKIWKCYTFLDHANKDISINKRLEQSILIKFSFNWKKKCRREKKPPKGTI